MARTSKTTLKTASTSQEEQLVSYFKKALYFEPVGSFLSGLFTTAVVLGVLLLGVKSAFDWRNSRLVPPVQPQITPAPLKIITFDQLPTQVNIELDPSDGQWYPINLPGKYTVKVGDSTWNIARAIYGDGNYYREIEKANGLTPDQALTVGEEVELPRLSVPAPEGVNPTPVTALPTPAPTPFPTATTLPSPMPVQGGKTYTVKKGEGLWQIAQQQYGDGNQYMRIFEANRDKMKTPEDIEEGMVLTLP